MKAIKTLLFSSVLAAAAGANAATIATFDYSDAYTTYGYSALTHKPILTTVYGNGTTAGSGTLDETGGVGTLTLNVSQYFVGTANAPAHQYDVSGTLVYTGSIDYSTNTFNITSGSLTLGACTANYGTGCAGVQENATTVVPFANQTVSLLNPTSVNIAGPVSGQPAYNDETWTFTPSNYTGQPSTPSVPVPAAAWLFGSGLLGLAGAARRRS
jgi:hypothetical protein